MADYLTVTAPGDTYTPALIPITGDRLIHPADVPNDLARIVLRWGRNWVPQTWAAREHFTGLGLPDGDPPTYPDEQVRGWLFLPPQADSLAARVRSGELDVATALSVEAEAWPMPQR